MKISLFLGAGASAQFDKPTTYQLRLLLQHKYAKDENNFLLPLLEHYPAGDIEDVLQTVKDLNDFFANRGGSFISKEFKIIFNKTVKRDTGRTVSGAKIVKEEVRPTDYENVVEKVKETLRVLEREIFENYQWDHDQDQKVQKIYDQLIREFKDDEIRVGTTNYDRVIEQYCSLSKYSCLCVDGFKWEQSAGRFVWNEDNLTKLVVDDKNTIDERSKKLYLYKLHGSLNWKRHKKYGIVRTDEESKSLDRNYTENLVIYPTISPKDGKELEPFKTLREEFAAYLNTCDICVVIGFSFRDEHINEIFKHYIKNGGRLIVISPEVPDILYRSIIKETNYNFGFLYKENIGDVNNITVIKDKFEDGKIGRIIDVIKSRTKKN